MFDIGLTVPMVFEGGVIEGLERAAEAGVEGIEFFEWESADTDALRRAADEHGIEVYGTLAAGAGSVIMDPDAASLAAPDSHGRAVTDLTRSIEAAAGMGCANLIVTVGQNDPRLDDATQHAAVVDALREVAPTAEDHDVTLVLEPLNVRVDHPGYFLPTTDASVEVVTAVGSPNVKLLFDVYHQQITDGDVLRRLGRQIEHVGHIHVADNPGRHEPGTGELAYERIFETIAALDYEGYVSGEFAPEGDPDEAVRAFVRLAEDARERTD